MYEGINNWDEKVTSADNHFSAQFAFQLSLLA